MKLRSRFRRRPACTTRGLADSLPVALPEPQADNQDGSHHSVNLTLADSDAAFLSGNQGVETGNINLAGGGGSVDLSAAGGVDLITVAGNGSLLIAGIASFGSPDIIIAPHSDVNLTFGVGSAGASPVIQLSGLDHLSLTDAPGTPLTLDSEGNGANRVTMDEAAVSGGAALDLTAAGTQDLLLQESAAAFDSTFFNTSTYSGSLTIALDLENASQSLDLSKVSAANYILTDGVASVDAANGAQIQLGSNLNIVEVSVAGTTASAPGSLLFDLGSGSGQTGLAFVDLLEPLLTSDIVLNSSGAGAGANMIRMLSDSSLALLTLTGDSGLTIGAIEGPTATDNQNITIDARDLTGALDLDVSNILDTAAGGRSITIIGGSGSNVLTNLTATENTTFILGPGQNTINIGAGSVSDSVGGLTSSTAINVGSAGYADIIVNE
jgi:hypothetical protein